MLSQVHLRYETNLEGKGQMLFYMLESYMYGLIISIYKISPKSSCIYLLGINAQFHFLASCRYVT